MPLQTAPTLPRVPPIVPVSRPAAFNDAAWLFEPKYDGVPRHGLPDPEELHNLLQARECLCRFPELCERICAELPRREVILDGEVVAIDDEGPRSRPAPGPASSS